VDEMKTELDAKRELLRHTLATLAYRGGKAISNAPDHFAAFRVYESTRTPGEILAHIGDLLDWALRTAQGEQIYKRSSPLPWEEESARFFAALKALDSCLASNIPLRCPAEKLFQGPIADALTHAFEAKTILLRRSKLEESAQISLRNGWNLIELAPGGSPPWIRRGASARRADVGVVRSVAHKARPTNHPTVSIGPVFPSSTCP